MRITLQLICDELHNYKGMIEGNGSDTGWYQVIRQEKREDACENLLLFGPASIFSGKIRNFGIICIGIPQKNILENNLVLYFPADIQELELYRALQNCFQKYHRWYDDLSRSLIESRSLQELFEIGQEAFENSMFFHDNNFYLLAVTKPVGSEHSWDYLPSRGIAILPIEIINDFKINPDYLATMSTRVPSVFPEKTFGYRILYQNLWYHGQYLGRICINEIRRTIRQSDFYLLNLFSELVLESFKVWEMPTDEYSQRLSQMLTHIIEGKNMDKMTLEKILMLRGWTVSDDYFCVCLFPDGNDIQIHSISYLCNKLRESFPHSCVFYHEERIIMLINSTLSECSIPAFQNKIAVFLREGLMKAGISSMGNDLNQFEYYYRQANSAYETGKHKQETFWSYCFDDYRTDFILRNALLQFPAKLLCGQELLRLEEYDTQHTSDLYHTLQIYLENDRSLTKTSEILGIHRTTLIYRVGRIEEICGTSLNDAENRFRLLLGYHLLEESRGHL